MARNSGLSPRTIIGGFGRGIGGVGLFGRRGHRVNHILTCNRHVIRRILEKNRVLNKIYHQYHNIYPYIYRYYRRIIKKKIDYWGCKIFTANRGNGLIAKRINSGEPSAIGALGTIEINALRRFFEYKGNVAAWDDSTKVTLYRNAGVFPLDNDIFYHWCLVFTDSLKSLDLIGVWYFTYESKLIKRFAPGATLVDKHSLAPYYHKDPWSICLKNRMVLVIHPFEKSIRQQFSYNRDRLWKDARILPDFQLDTIKVPLSDALVKSEFKDWFCALEHMKRQISEKQFDIALIGAGAYSIPLAAHVKNKGKCAVHLGGSTQILFGIKGRRWDNFGIYNEYWTRPSQEETPEKVSIIERGCYW
jgi:hypothetical protein